MRRLFLLILFSFFHFAIQAQEAEQVFLKNGEILFEASPDLKQKNATQSDMQEIMLLDLSKGKIQRLTSDRSKDSNPSFFRNGSIIFDSKRPCEGGLAENCPSKLFTVSEGNSVDKLNLALDDAMRRVQEESRQDSLYSKLKKLGIQIFNSENFSVEEPIYNNEKNYLAFIYSTPRSFLVVYNLNTDKLHYIDKIPGSSSNFKWSPNGKYLAYSYSILDGLFPKGSKNVIIDIETLEVSTLELDNEDLRFENWSLDGKYLLLSNRFENEKGHFITDGYKLEWPTQKVQKINENLLPFVSSWIQIVSDNQYLVQKFDEDSNFDLWIIDSDGADVQRLTEDGRLKFVTDTKSN
ncbi:TolB family protein [Fodinibius salsisoli]|uniref:WD40-like Beta Propeller Repeat n=1 Tax=Fodinibius salsisoli TaxID=2820877 RepID=A0ABT3PMS9_9BACT|nr:hypothetical protein [Fodinibius salsisoli]MCW9707253.1 hypothetical protein [Fodinibius salsisoli]